MSPPFKCLNFRIPIIIPRKGWGFISQGCTLSVNPLLRLQKSRAQLLGFPQYRDNGRTGNDYLGFGV